MSTVTKKQTKQQNIAALTSLISNHKIAESGTGNPFWVVNLDKLFQFDCTLALSANKNVYLIPDMTGVKNPDGSPAQARHINLGSHFDAIQTYEEQIGETITVNVAVRQVNPSVTQEDLDRVSAQFGPRAIAAYTKAKASGEETIVLVNYVMEE